MPASSPITSPFLLISNEQMLLVFCFGFLFLAVLGLFETFRLFLVTSSHLPVVAHGLKLARSRLQCDGLSCSTACEILVPDQGLSPRLCTGSSFLATGATGSPADASLEFSCLVWHLGGAGQYSRLW